MENNKKHCCIVRTHQIASYHQPCHREFTVKVIGSTNMFCMVNHAMEDLQHRILDLSKKTHTADTTVITEQEQREKQKSNN